MPDGDQDGDQDKERLSDRLRRTFLKPAPEGGGKPAPFDKPHHGRRDRRRRSSGPTTRSAWSGSSPPRWLPPSGCWSRASLIANDPKAHLANGAINKPHVNPSLYVEFGARRHRPRPCHAGLRPGSASASSWASPWPSTGSPSSTSTFGDSECPSSWSGLVPRPGLPPAEKLKTAKAEGGGSAGRQSTAGRTSGTRRRPPLPASRPSQTGKERRAG